MQKKSDIGEFSLSLPSPVEMITFEGRSIYLKRDDLIHQDFSGNKARKFYHYLYSDFPDIRKVVSYGSSQSNAMYSLSVLARMRGWEFEYRVDHISDYLRENPQGNYRRALENGMVIREGEGKERTVQERGVLYIEEGGREKEAESGLGVLAEEIVSWQQEKQIERLSVFLPSGTGTSALFLQKRIAFLTYRTSMETVVYTTPCAGGSDYLKKQFRQLEEEEALHPTILEREKKYHFGKLYRDSYKIWLKLRRETGVEFDLLYDPKGWMVLMENPELFSGETLYIHQGGLIGNESMLPRYERKYKELTREDILQQ